MKKVLVVDDEEQPRKFFKKYLENKEFLKVKGYENAEYNVSVASTKAEAEDKIKKEPFDFILVDLRLDDPSEFGGIDVFLFARREQPNAKAIIVSAYPFVDPERDEKDAANQVREEFTKKLKNEPNSENSLKEIELKYYISKTSECNILFTILDKLRELSQ